MYATHWEIAIVSQQATAVTVMSSILSVLELITHLDHDRRCCCCVTPHVQDAIIDIIMHTDAGSDSIIKQQVSWLSTTKIH